MGRCGTVDHTKVQGWVPGSAGEGVSFQKRLLPCRRTIVDILTGLYQQRKLGSPKSECDF